MPSSGDPPRPRKDRLIQTRVPRTLETTLKQEAKRRRLTVSHLIRSVLEDTFDLVGGMVSDLDEIVGDSARLTESVRRNARRLVSPDRAPAGGADPPGADFPDVYAWNQLVLNRPASCSRCETRIARGECGFFGLSDASDAPRTCLCARCAAALSIPSS